MTHDPATLAAVRERIEKLRRNPPNDDWDMGFNAGLNAARSMIADEIAGTFRSAAADPPLTPAEVRRIAREEVVNALATLHVPTRSMIAGARAKAVITDDPPPAPPPAKRVEAWAMQYKDGKFSLRESRQDALDDGLDTSAIGDILYLTTFPGVTDAASAEAFEWAVRDARNTLREAMRPLDKAWHYSIGKTIDALAPFIPPVPR